MAVGHSIRWFAKKYLPKNITNRLRNSLPESIYYPGYGQTTLSTKKLDSMLNSLDECISKKIEGDVIECGVFRGGSLVKIGLKMKERKSKKNLYGVDTFEGHPYDSVEDVPKDGNVIHHSGLFSGNSYEKVLESLKENQIGNVKLLKGKVEDVLSQLSDKKFCFVHLDLDLYISTKEALSFLKPKLVKNGIIVFDDYGADESPGIKKAVEEVLGKNLVKETLNSKDGNQAYWIND